ncbi:MAG: hypothetical protein OXI27_00230 [Thaumarchaeota archaeon]|nr:hypothetical protein [Nitrososphaerota archaeon]
MTLSVKSLNGIEYLYFQAGKASVYIGPRDDPAKAKTENVIRALDHTRERMDHYDDSFDELLSFLSPDARRQYLAKEITRLTGKVTRYRKQQSTR